MEMKKNWAEREVSPASQNALMENIGRTSRDRLVHDDYYKTGIVQGGIH